MKSVASPSLHNFIECEAVYYLDTANLFGPLFRFVRNPSNLPDLDAVMEDFQQFVVCIVRKACR